MRARRAAVAAAVLGLLPFAGRALAGPAGVASAVEDEFEAAIKVVNPATVFCVAPSKYGASPGSSGVLISRDGYVLSDADAGAYYRPVPAGDGKQRAEKAWADDVEVRVPDLKRGTYGVFTAKRVKRVEAIDSCLLKIDKPPSGGFPFVPPGSSAHLEVGQFTFAVGTSFPQGEGDGSSSLTAGVVASLLPLGTGDPAGRWAEVITSAAVNPGVNGGPLVDADGALVGIISTWGQATPDEPFQFLGKAFPIDRIRNAYKDVPAYATVFPDPRSIPVRAKQTALLEQAIAATATTVARSVVSLSVSRKSALETKLPQAKVARYLGPTSGVVLTDDGYVAASLYAFADTLPLPIPQAAGQRDAEQAVADDLAEVTSITAWLPDGSSAPAHVVAHDQRLGAVLVKVDLPPGVKTVPLEPAPADALRPGRLVIGVSNPFGGKPRPAPVVTVGMLSRVHADDAVECWGGAFQTDANMTDGTVGGALVDVRGRFLGMGTLWLTVQQGRNSGIGYGVPGTKLLAALPSLRAGTSFLLNSAVMKVELKQDPKRAELAKVVAGGPADVAGLKAGDVIVGVGGKPVADPGELRQRLRFRRPGERVVVAYERGGKRAEVTVELGRREAPAAATKPTTPAQPAMSDAPPAMTDPAPAMDGEAPPAMSDAPKPAPPAGEPAPDGPSAPPAMGG
ncbi:MAG: trypsin-like peptidase domain-containing protein [Planctomycetota bacterium]